MKIIVSHDVDHLTFGEHARDAIVPKYLARAFLERGRGMITTRELGARLRALAANRMERVDELVAFDRAQGVPSTWFFGVQEGRDLRYSFDAVKPLVQRVLDAGLPVGVHGVATDDPRAVRREFQWFANAFGLWGFGVRLHNVGMAAHAERLTREHHALFEEVGYAFTSNTYALAAPYRLGGIWEFPLQLMDGYVFYWESSTQARTLDEAKAWTLGRVDEAEAAGLPYLNLLFHDTYFFEGFEAMAGWYRWLIGELRARGHAFIDFQGALAELSEGPA